MANPNFNFNFEWIVAIIVLQRILRMMVSVMLSSFNRHKLWNNKDKFIMSITADYIGMVLTWLIFTNTIIRI